MIEDNEVYVVVDIETDGPVPGLYSMISLAAVATTESEEIDNFYRKLEPLEGASQAPSTMAGWKTEPEAWQEATSDAQPASKVMAEFSKWLDILSKRPVFVAHLIAFDYSYVSWYLWRFMNNNPFANHEGASRTLDITSFIAAKFGLSLNMSKRKNFPEWISKGMPEHSHNALDDARGYAIVLRNILATKPKRDED